MKGEGKRQRREALLIEITDQRPIHAILPLQEQIFPSAPCVVGEALTLAEYGIAWQESQQHHLLRASSADLSCLGILPTDPYRHAVWMPLHTPLVFQDHVKRRAIVASAGPSSEANYTGSGIRRHHHSKRQCCVATVTR